MTFCTLKLDEEKSKCAGLAQETGFTTNFLSLLAEAGKRHSKAVHLLLKCAGLAQETGFITNFLSLLAEAGKRRSKAVHLLLEKSVINMI